MPDLILSLPRYHRHIAICVVQIINTPHNFRPCVSFAGFVFYIAVRCGFDKHFYLTDMPHFWDGNPCLVGILANTPGGVKRSGLGAHAVGLLVVY